ncbi:hypothetical protein NECAME_01146 [Necator americanus]|uniref:Uncharacterized protein n=1 Tax=Necator americanus TaxID=51031 RepID=W2SJH3_NECAM|nr:hypothetical protein NECAME_01146 [Necator americanus]ETN69036.1 hypothetical protein NECAME_01146 [Necator americanus]
MIPPHIAAAVALSMNHRMAQTSTPPFDPTTISVSSFPTLSRDSPPVASSPTLSCAVCGDVFLHVMVVLDSSKDLFVGGSYIVFPAVTDLDYSSVISIRLRYLSYPQGCLE